MKIRKNEARYILEIQRMRGPVTGEHVDEYQESLNEWYTKESRYFNRNGMNRLVEKLKELNER